MEDATRVLRESLRAALAASGMRQEDFARRGGIRQPHVSDVLSGHKRPGPKTLRAVLLVFPHLRPQVLAVLTAKPDREKGSEGGEAA